MSKRMLLTLLALLLLATLSLFPVNSPTSIAKAQSSNSSLPNTVWREYPYIAPHLIENATHYIYVTDWGNYTFSKAAPYVYRYTYRNGKTMVSFSTFWINTTSALTPLNPTVLIANNTYFRVQVDTYKLTTKMATIIQEWNFNKTDKPKISVSLAKTANWSLGDFNIFWVVAGHQYVKENETSTIYCNKTMSYWKKGVKVEIGESANINDWREWLIVDWGDEGVADVWLGQFSIFGYSLAVVKVDFTINDGQIDPSVVGTSTTDYATLHAFQRKCFYANGRFWVFYSDGTNMVYRTSTDGSTWTSATTVRAADAGFQFSVWFDGTYLHYAYASGNKIYYRRGTPNTNGTITWSATEQTVSTTYNQATFPMVSVDSNGYVWIGYRDYDGTNNYPYVIRSGNNDGTWGTTPSGFPYQLSTTSAYWFVSVIPLTSGKMLVVYACDSATVKARIWNGSALGTEVATTSAIFVGSCHSAVAQGDDVHLTFLASTHDILYVKYTYASNSFGAETTLVASATLYSAPVISIDISTNDLYVFAATKTTGTPSGWTANHIYYIKYTASSGTWGSWVDWIDETTETLYSADRLTCFYQAYSNNIGLVYLTKTASPYNVKFAFLNLNSPPNAPTLNSPAANYRFNPGASVTFSWTFSDNDTGDSQSAYQLQIGDSNFTTIYVDTGKVTSTSTSTTVTLPSTVGVYYWRVSTWDTYGGVQGAWSAGRAIIVDRVKVNSLTASKARLDVGATVTLSVQLIYEYDSAYISSGSFTLDGLTLTYSGSNGIWTATDSKSSVQAVTYNSVAGTEGTYGLTTVNMNGKSATVIWDKLNVVFSVSDDNPDLGTPVTVSWTITRLFDSSTVTDFTITVMRNGTVWRQNVPNANATDQVNSGGLTTYTYSCSAITDRTYGLTAFTQTPIKVTWHFITKTLRTYNSQLESQGNPYIKTSTHLVTALSYTTGTLTFTVQVPKGETSETTVKGLGYMPRAVYIDGLYAQNLPTRTDYNSYGGKCWYYSPAEDLTYIKTTGSTIQIIYEPYAPPPPEYTSPPPPPPQYYDLKITLAPTTIYWLFQPKFTVQVEIYNPTGITADVTLKWQIINSQGQTVAEGQQILLVKAQESRTATITIQPPHPLTPETYKITAQITTPIQSNIATQTIHIQPTPTWLPPLLIILIITSAICVKRKPK